ncbi:MAG: hypothetical protein IT204_21770 [Fimbriimonadaceae bacterium]|nr:hypothetical protein [Fimbriimonadaceae bacterium]
MILEAQCELCQHYRGLVAGRTDRHPTCAAFPDGIPMAILALQADHRLPYPDDQGIRWAAQDGITERQVVFIAPEDYL